MQTLRMGQFWGQNPNPHISQILCFTLLWILYIYAACHHYHIQPLTAAWSQDANVGVRNLDRMAGMIIRVRHLLPGRLRWGFLNETACWTNISLGGWMSSPFQNWTRVGGWRPNFPSPYQIHRPVAADGSPATTRSDSTRSFECQTLTFATNLDLEKVSARAFNSPIAASKTSKVWRRSLLLVHPSTHNDGKSRWRHKPNCLIIIIMWLHGRLNTFFHLLFYFLTRIAQTFTIAAPKLLPELSH